MKINVETARNFLIGIADFQKREFPQYRGRFDNMVLVRFKRDFTTKAGLAFSAGEYAIAEIDDLDRRYVVAYSSNNEGLTQVARSEVDFVN